MPQLCGVAGTASWQQQATAMASAREGLVAHWPIGGAVNDGDGPGKLATPDGNPRGTRAPGGS